MKYKELYKETTQKAMNWANGQEEFIKELSILDKALFNKILSIGPMSFEDNKKLLKHLKMLKISAQVWFILSGRVHGTSYNK